MEPDKGMMTIGLFLVLPVVLFFSFMLWRARPRKEPEEGKFTELSATILSMMNRSRLLLNRPEHAAESQQAAADALNLARSPANCQPWLIGLAYQAVALTEEHRGWGEQARASMVRAYTILREWPDCTLAERARRDIKAWLENCDDKRGEWQQRWEWR